jgi:hypothetical protein
MPNGKGNVTPVKNGIHCRRNYPKKEEKVESESLLAKPQSL